MQALAASCEDWKSAFMPDILLVEGRELARNGIKKIKSDSLLPWF
jgi:hypothetical protein